MSRVLPDYEVKKLIGTVLLGADEKCLNPNGIEFRLGRQVFFHSTEELLELNEGQYLAVEPAEHLIICSLESLDFSAETVQQHYPGKMLMAFITPTTTMMREGFLNSATKVDAGYKGDLNWGLQNQSMKEVKLGFGEPIFKLTLLLLEPDEVPEVPYGLGEKHAYHETKGIRESTRRIPVSLRDNQVVRASAKKKNPEEQLKAAGGPYGWISTQLTEVNGELVIVHNEIAAIKDEFQKTTIDLGGRIDRLGLVIDANFHKQTIWFATMVLVGIPIFFAVWNTIQDQDLSLAVVIVAMVLLSSLFGVVGWLLLKYGPKKPE